MKRDVQGALLLMLMGIENFLDALGMDEKTFQASKGRIADVFTDIMHDYAAAHGKDLWPLN